MTLLPADSPLLRPYQLGPLSLKNRVLMAPMTRSRAVAGNAPGPSTATYYAQRASAGLIVTEATQVSPQGVGYVDTPGIHTAEQARGWRLVTDAVHAAGGLIFLQLWHVGRVSHVSLQPGRQAPVAPSAIAVQGETFTPEGKRPFSAPRALEPGEIAGVVAQFAEGARLAQAAGFDGVELHGANGYLIDQFLRDGSNRRSDAYGGSVENRARFLLEVTEAVTGVWGPERVGVRLSPLGSYNDMADSDPAATFSYAARELSARRVGYLHVVEPVSGPMAAAGPRVSPLLREQFRGAFVANGGYDAASAHGALSRGEADLVSFGVPFLANPDLPERFRRGAGLNAPDRATFYGGGDRGYTDYPALTSS
ncbi:MAG TPA: alkene reductase [Polyangiaceae bacterium]|nr:alkene reductase [Polyangiaceae bacterium]